VEVNHAGQFRVILMYYISYDNRLIAKLVIVLFIEVEKKKELSS
jgi:hypothetical protein